MDPRPEQLRIVSEIALPSGRTVKVTYFAGTAAAPRETRAPHACPKCASNLVYPVAWEMEADGLWVLHLRCPNCEWNVAGRYDRDAIERLEEEHERGEYALLADLERLTRANLEEEFERFIAALRADHIQPMDF
jgi:ribosomal protein L37AE/L43A